MILKLGLLSLVQIVEIWRIAGALSDESARGDAAARFGLIAGYARKGKLNDAHQLVDESICKDSISWSIKKCRKLMDDRGARKKAACTVIDADNEEPMDLLLHATFGLKCRKLMDDRGARKKAACTVIDADNEEPMDLLLHATFGLVPLLCAEAVLDTMSLQASLVLMDELFEGMGTARQVFEEISNIDFSVMEHSDRWLYEL
ncbi:hypothetical protein COCNU_scaffold006737G000030 [Cocos nucifera]|nr:hypothetical protein [Cocos nucifera]